jgi:hypothetical protein
MAYIILNNNPGLTVYRVIAGNDLQYHPNQYSNTSNYIKIEITEDEFLELKKLNKTIDTKTNQSVTFRNTTLNYIQNAESMQTYIDFLIEFFSNWQKGHGNNGYSTRVNNYLTFLQNFDTSGLTYPMTQSFENYLSSINQDFLIIEEMI